MNCVKLGVIGVGNMGTGHLENFLQGLCPEIQVTAAADRRESRRAWFTEHFPEAAVFSEGEELISSGKCEAVLICVPHYQHPPLAISAMRHGLHAMVEKPSGVYTLQVKEMNAEADRHPELTFGLMFNQRTDCLYRKMKEMLDSGELGTLKRMSWLITNWYRTQAYYDSGAWRATWAGEGGGVLLNQCPHNLDLWQWICGMPVKVRAFCHNGKWHDIEVEDNVTAYFEYPNGATGVFITTTGEAPGTNRLEVCGEYGRVVIENGRICWTRNEIGQAEFLRTSESSFATPETWNVDIPANGNGSQHVGILQNFVNAILNGEKLIAPAEDGIRSVELGNAMLYSSMKGKTVEFPLDGKAYERMLKGLIKGSRRGKKEVKAAVGDFSASFGK